MKVIHVECGTNLYGGALQVLYLLRGLRERGIGSLLICPAGSAVEQAAGEAGLDTAPVKYRGELDPSLLLSLLGHLRSGTGVRILHAHSRRGADTWASAAARITGVPLIITRRVDNLESRTAARFKYGRAAAVVAISRAIAEILAGQGVEQEKIRLIYSAVDTSLYRPGGDRSALQEELSLPAHAKLVGMVSQFIPRKGHDVMLECIRNMVSEVPDARFLFFGKGSLKEKIGNMAAEMGIGDACRFCGFREDLPALLPSLDLLVHPAVMEGLGVSLLQASACGVPIVAAKAGGIPEVVIQGKTGVLVPPGDPQALARAVIRLLKEREEAERMGRAGRRMVEQRFSIDRMVEEYLDLYCQVASREATR